LPVLGKSGERFAQGLVVGVDPEAEQVALARRPVGRQLDAGTIRTAAPSPAAARRAFGDARRGVVVGDRSSDRPRSRAARTSSVGVSVPSDAVVCVWRSAYMGGA
jgi:hypothetical protein